MLVNIMKTATTTTTTDRREEKLLRYDAVELHRA